MSWDIEAEERRLRADEEHEYCYPTRTEVCGWCGKLHFVDRNGEFYGECKAKDDGQGAA